LVFPPTHLTIGAAAVSERGARARVPLWARGDRSAMRAIVEGGDHRREFLTARCGTSKSASQTASINPYGRAGRGPIHSLANLSSRQIALN